MKPCDAVRGLPCAGGSGACLGRPYWDQKPFSNQSGPKHKNKRRQAHVDMDACPWATQVSAWWERSDAIFTRAWTPGERIAFEAAVRAEVYKPHLRGKEAQPEQYTEEVA